MKKTKRKTLGIETKGIQFTSILMVLVCIFLVACTSDNTNTQLETEIIQASTSQNSGDLTRSLTEVPSTPLAPPLPSPTATEPPPTDTPSPTATLICENNLSFLSDVTIPDGMELLRGSTVEKIWLVVNSGSCNWGAHHRIRLIEGPSLGAITEQALFPAPSGTQTTIRIVFTAPLEPGRYRSAWGAYSPQGDQFGDIIYIELVVI